MQKIDSSDELLQEEAHVFELKIEDEYENLTPAYTDKDFDELVNSLRENGQLVPGLVNQHNVILDAHHRYRGCKKVGIPFRYIKEYFNSKADEILRTVELNGNRRQMNKVQRAVLFLRAKAELEKLAKENMSLGGKGVRIQTPLGRIDEQLAKRAHTTRYTIRSVDQLLKDAQENPEMRLEKSYDGRYHGVSGPSYAELAQEALLENISLSKACMMIKHHKAILKSREEADLAARSFHLPEKVTILNKDSTKLDEIPELKDNSVDLIVTDPPYMEGSLPLFEALAKLASAKLKEGGSLVFYYGIPWEPQVHAIFAKYEKLKWWWRFSVYHESAQAVRIHIRGVRVHGKPMMWFVKGEKKLITNSDIKDFIFSKKADKTKHPWAQSPVEAEYLIKNLTISEDSLVVDPFLGSGTFGIPAIKLDRWFIGIEKDPEVCKGAESNLKNEAAKIGRG